MGAGLGYLAGGVSQGFGQGLKYGEEIQNNKATSTLGAAARILAGGGQQDQSGGQTPSSTQQPQLGGLMGQQASPSAPASQPPPQAPQPQAGMARSPTPQPPQQIPNAPIVQPPPQAAPPPIANASPPPPLQQQSPPASPPPQQAPQQSPPQQTQQQVQQQIRSGIAPSPQMFSQPIWTPQMVAGAILKARPNASDRELGQGLLKFREAGLLSPQGLTQYEAMRLSLAERGLDLAERRADTGSEREKRLEQGAEAKPEQQARMEQIKAMRQTALAKYRAIMQQLSLNPDPEKQKAADKALDEANAKADEMEKSPASGGGGSKKSELIKQAKEAIDQGAPKEKVLERMKQLGLSEQDLQ